MNRHLVLLLVADLLLVTTGCTTRNASPADRGTLPISEERQMKGAAATLEESCALLNTRDLASIFPTHTETILPKPKITSVDHPAFSMQRAPGMETSCVYYSFYLPGSHSEIVLQVNYWLDVPRSGSAFQAWQQAWTSSALNKQAAPRIGDGSFYANGQVSFKRADLYMTVAATETDWNLSLASDRNKQLALERQVAEDMLSHLQ